MRQILQVFLLLIVLLVMACGQRGGLYIPDEENQFVNGRLNDTRSISTS